MNFITRVQYVYKIFCIHYMYVFTKRHAHRDVYFFLIQIHTFLLFNVLKREVSNVFLYIWTINYSYSYSYSYNTKDFIRTVRSRSCQFLHTQSI